MLNNCKFFILAGGYGKRAQPLSLFKPKPLFPLGGRPLLQILLNQLQGKGLGEGFINLHYKPQPLRQCAEETIKKTGLPTVRFLYEKALSGSKIIKEAAHGMTDEELLLVMNGDSFLEFPLEKMQEKFLKEKADGIILVRENKEKDPQYKIILSQDDCFLGRKIFNSSDNCPVDEPLMFTGVSLFSKKVVQAVNQINFFDLLEKSDFKIKVLIYDGIWLDIGDPRSYFESDLKYRAHIGVKDANSLSQNVTISPDSLVKDCIIWENTEIKNQSRLKKCIVTGNIVLNNVHFENKIVNKDSVEEGFMI